MPLANRLSALLSTLAFLGLAALLAGLTVTGLVEARLIATAGVKGVPSALPTQARPGAPVADRQAVTARNIFCSNCGRSRPGPAPSRDPRLFTLQGLELLATLVHPARPAASVALIRAARATRLVQAGCLLGGGRVLRVGSDRVTIAREAALAELTFCARPLSGHRRGAPADREIRRLGPGRYEVPRDLIRRLLLNPGPLERDALVRLRPGAAAVEVERVRPGGLHERLGLRSGDRIQAIAGVALTDLDRLLDLYGRLDALARLQMAILRNGHSRKITYRLR